jgi:hypothetical protein
MAIIRSIVGRSCLRLPGRPNQTREKADAGLCGKWYETFHELLLSILVSQCGHFVCEWTFLAALITGKSQNEHLPMTVAHAEATVNINLSLSINLD